MDKQTIVNRIDDLIIEKGITKYQLKENAEISNTIYQWRKNSIRDKDRTPSLRSIEKICDFLGVSLAYFFTFNQEDQQLMKVKEIAMLIEKLPEAQKELIITLIGQLK